MEQEFVGLFARGCAIVARDLDIDVLRQCRATQLLQPVDEIRGDIDGVGPGPLGDGDRDRRHAHQFAILVFGELPALLLQRLPAYDDLGDVLDIDRAAVARRQEKKPDIGNALQRLARYNRHGAALVADLAREERAVRRAHLVHELGQRHSIKRELFGVGLDPDLIGPPANDVGEAHIIDLGQLDPQILGEMIERIVGPALGGFRLGRNRQADDGDIVDAAPHDQGLGDANGDAVHVGAHFLMHAQNRFVGFRADEKARGDEHLIVVGLAVDVLDAVDSLHDGFKRLRHEPFRVLRRQAVGANLDIDHRRRDLRLFLARKLNKGDGPQH